MRGRSWRMAHDGGQARRRKARIGFTIFHFGGRPVFWWWTKFPQSKTDMYRSALVAAWLLAATGCVDSLTVDDLTQDSVRVETDHVSADGSSIRFKWGLPYLLVGEKRYVDAAVFDVLGGEVDGAPIEFVAADPTKIRVAHDGAVLGLDVGTAHVVARSGALETRLQIGVESDRAARLQLSVNEVEMTWLDEQQVFVTAFNERDRMLSSAVTWSCLDPDVATVAGGRITAVGPGTTLVEATSGDATATVEVRIVAPPPTYVEVVDAPMTLVEGEEDIITAVALAEDRRPIEDAVLQFESLAPQILAVDGVTGAVRALAEGQARVTVRSGEMSTSVRIVVVPSGPN